MKAIRHRNDHVEKVWPEVIELLQPAIERSNGKYKIGDVWYHLMNNDFQLWTIHEGDKITMACVTEVIDYPSKRVLLSLFMGGSGVDELEPFHHILESFAKANDCKAMEIWGRTGWERKMKQVGYTKTMVLLEKAL